MKSLVLALLVVTTPVRGQAPNPASQILPLWNGRAAGATGDTDADTPSITVLRARSGGRGGGTAAPAMIVAPGGGYSVLVEGEGRPVAAWLNTLGITAVVLKYRIAPYHDPIELADAQRAIRVVRARASELAIDPNRIGMIGFSAEHDLRPVPILSIVHAAKLHARHVHRPATLQGFYNDDWDTFDDRGHSFYQAPSTWTESAITWNNQPGSIGGPLGTFNPALGTPGTLQSWNVTAPVNDAYLADTLLYSVLFRADDESPGAGAVLNNNLEYFASREFMGGAHAFRIDVAVATVPEPGTLLLLGIGVAAAMRNRQLTRSKARRPLAVPNPCQAGAKIACVHSRQYGMTGSLS